MGCNCIITPQFILSYTPQIKQKPIWFLSKTKIVFVSLQLFSFLSKTKAHFSQPRRKRSQPRWKPSLCLSSSLALSSSPETNSFCSVAVFIAITVTEIIITVTKRNKQQNDENKTGSNLSYMISCSFSLSLSYIEHCSQIVLKSSQIDSLISN